MKNDIFRKFKENQILFCIRPSIVEKSRPIDFGEDRLMERGSLQATFYVLTRVFFWQMCIRDRYANNHLILFEFAALIVCHNIYPFKK